MEIHSSRLDAGNPFARQQQLARVMREGMTRLPDRTRAQVLAQALPATFPPSAPAASYPLVPTAVQAVTAPAQPTYPTAIYRPLRVARPLPWQLALVLKGLRLSRRIQKLWVREMRDARHELRRLLRHLLRALVRRWGAQGTSAGVRRVLPGHARMRGATAQRFARH